MLAAVLAGAAFAQTGDGPTLSREARGLWVATVGNIDWPTSRTSTVAQQQTQARAILDRAVAMNLNKIVLQVRPQCDALYRSNLEPWSPYLTNQMGVAPSPAWDPLQFWIDEARARGLELHAWFNPYRALSDATSTSAPSHISNRRPNWCVPYGGDLWLDPGNPQVAAYSLSVIMDVVARYDIDAVHLDDYFYPYPQAGVPFPDSQTYALYGGGLTLEDWRRKNVDDFVRRLYTSVKARKPWVKVGISPFGIWKSGTPSGIAGLSSFDAIYADSRMWLQQGWVDYFSPQLYWRISATQQSFPVLNNWWQQQNPANNRRHVWPGLFTSNVATWNDNWPVSEIVNQITETRTRSTAYTAGSIHFSARAFRDNYKGIVETLTGGVYSAPAFVPESPWLDAIAPAAPQITSVTMPTATSYRVQWQNQATEPIRRFVVATRYGTTWSVRNFGPNVTQADVPSSTSSGALTRIAVLAMDRTSNASAWSGQDISNPE